jgi:hypothetical protein
MKGMVRNFTAGPAFNSALRLEQMGRAGDLNGAEALFPGLEREVSELQAALLGLVGV